jgi:hypothetical protein
LKIIVASKRFGSQTNSSGTSKCACVEVLLACCTLMCAAPRRPWCPLVPRGHLLQDKKCPVALFHSDDGERVGTYSGHDGAVFCLDVTSACLRFDAARRCQLVPSCHVFYGGASCRGLQVAHHSRSGQFCQVMGCREGHRVVQMGHSSTGTFVCICSDGPAPGSVHNKRICYSSAINTLHPHR